MNKLIHYGNNNIFRRRTSCGELKEQINTNDWRKIYQNYSSKPSEVNCQTCIRKILKNQTYNSKRTEEWLNRLIELKSIQNNPQLENPQSNLPHTKII